MKYFYENLDAVSLETLAHQSKKIERIIIFLLCSVIFLAFISPTMDNDMPWHLKTGEYILNNMELPLSDPFSYAEVNISSFGSFILTQYWLAQIVFWFVYKIFGVIGISLLPALVFSLIAFLLFSMIRSKNIILAVFVISCYLLVFLKGFDTLRPQIFTFLFATLTLYSIHKFKETNRFWYIIFLPILFIVWANMHGGYIFGIVILAIYVISDFISLIYPNYFGSEVNPKYFKRFLLISFLSLGVCYLNPNGYAAFGYAFLTHSTEVFSEVLEYKSPLQLDALSTTQLIRFWFTIPLSVSVLVFGIMKRNIGPVILVGFSLLMAFTAIRYFPLLVIVTTASLGQLSKKFEFQLFKMKTEVMKVIAMVILVGIIFLLFSKLNKNTFDYTKSPYNPSGAIHFLKENGIHGNIYGSYNKSSHLIFELYPQSKVFWSSNFISNERYRDGRIIGGENVTNNIPLAIYSYFPKEIGIKITEPEGDDLKKNYEEWQKKLYDSKTEIVVHEVLNIISGEPYPLVFLLLQKQDWKPIYFDGEVVILLKNLSKYQSLIKQFEKPATLLYDQLIYEGTRGWISGKAYFPALAALGYLLKGDSGDFTEDLIRSALESDPQNQYAKIDDLILKKMRKIEKNL